MAQLKQYFEAYDRPYMRIQLHMLQAMIDRRSGRGDWRAELTAAKETPDGSCNKPLSGVFHYKPYFSRRRAASLYACSSARAETTMILMTVSMISTLYTTRIPKSRNLILQ